MCHWVLRVWKCGDSFFTKYSSCSFDRAVHDPANLLNPLHPSITPIGTNNCVSHVGAELPLTSSKSPMFEEHKNNNRSDLERNLKNTPRRSTMPYNKNDIVTTPLLSRPALPTIDLSSPRGTRVAPGCNDAVVYPKDAVTGKTIPIPLSEIGKASRFGDKTLGEGRNCNVFEVVLQTKETSICPACARSSKRARLPAHARGCFGMS